MTTAEVFDVRRLVRLATVLTALAIAIALITGVAFGAQMRALLSFRFPGVPPRLTSAAEILANNCRLVIGVGVGALTAQLRLRDAGGEAGHGVGDMLTRCAAVTIDIGLLVVVLLNVLVVGAAVGAYGGRMLLALLPHGPLELVGYCVALNFYLRARRSQIAASSWAWAAASTLLILTAAALLETFLPLS